MATPAPPTLAACWALVGASLSPPLTSPREWAAVLALNLLTNLVSHETGDRASAAPGMLAGAAALVGHVWPVWTRFRGGRGAATAAGVMSAILSWPVLIMFAPTMAILYLTRSTTAALAFAYLSSVAVAKVHFRGVVGAHFVLPGIIRGRGAGPSLERSIPRQPIRRNGGIRLGGAPTGKAPRRHTIARIVVPATIMAMATDLAVSAAGLMDSRSNPSVRQLNSVPTTNTNSGRVASTADASET